MAREKKPKKVKTRNTMKVSILTKLPIIALAACLFAAAAESMAQTNTNTAPPIVRILATDPTALEGTSTAAFTLIRSGPTNEALTVDLTLSGSASNGVDYVAVKTPITIPAGFLAVDIPIVPIVVNTGNKTVVATLGTNGPTPVAAAFFRQTAVVTIIDDTFNAPPPTVTILTPTNGSTFTAPATFTLTATASEPDYAISGVTYFLNDFPVGSATNSPYSLTVSNIRAGRYGIFARAVDTAGQTAFSTPIEITVTRTNSTPPPGSNTPPPAVSALTR
jgi:Bacterial Ig domain